MRTPGSVALGDAAAKATHISIACTRCERHGLYALSRLVARLGPDFAMTDLGAELTTCTRRQASAAQERCDVYFPNLISVMTGVDDEKNPGVS
jgi:hypothetical protein